MSARIRVEPQPAVGGRPVTVYGYDFCTDTTCSDVTIAIEQRVVARDVRVAADGTFAVDVPVSEPEGQYRVVASQRRANVATEVVTRMIVATIDVPKATSSSSATATTRPAPTTSEPTSTARTVPVTVPSSTLATNEPAGAKEQGRDWWLPGLAGALVAVMAAAVVVGRRRSR